MSTRQQGYRSKDIGTVHQHNRAVKSSLQNGRPQLCGVHVSETYSAPFGIPALHRPRSSLTQRILANPDTSEMEALGEVVTHLLCLDLITTSSSSFAHARYTVGRIPSLA